METNKNITLTYRAVVQAGNFWQKMVHTPCPEQQHSYWIFKLTKIIEKTQKKVTPVWLEFTKELAEKCATRDADGKPKVSQNGMPECDPTKRELYDDMLDAFMSKTIDLEFKVLPLEYFSHIQKTPLDWEIMEQITDVSMEKLDTDSKAKKNAHASLHALTGGQAS